ncbi:MAG: hypothetical protein EP343_09305 [Deltaproteobacteria bacterium]|nr:MAG: hypothetical protein EP343_09305 [Deltaproteobacteria bacterium]
MSLFRWSCRLSLLVVATLLVWSSWVHANPASRSTSGPVLTLKTCHSLSSSLATIDSTGALVTEVLRLHTQTPSLMRSVMYFGFSGTKLMGLVRELKTLAQVLRKSKASRQKASVALAHYVIRCGHTPETLRFLSRVHKALVRYQKMTSGTGVSQEGAVLMMCKRTCNPLKKNLAWGVPGKEAPSASCYVCNKCLQSPGQSTCYQGLGWVLRFVHRQVLAGISVQEMRTLVEGTVQRLGSARAFALRTTVSPEEQRFLTTTWFKGLNSATRSMLFASPTRRWKLSLWGAKYGVFKEAWRGLAFYGDLNGTFAKLLAQRQGLAGRQRKTFLRTFSSSFFSVDAIEALSGLRVVLRSSQQNPRGAFSLYNPKFVRWAVNNLLPSRRIYIASLANYQIVYRQVFRRLARLLAESYLTLQRSFSVQKEVTRYLNTVKKTSALKYLPSRFHGKLTSYVVPNAHLQPANAFGFWLRRHVDHTAPELWRGLRKLLYAYDARWFRATLARYRNASKTKP